MIPTGPRKTTRLKQGRSFLGGKGSRKPANRIEQLIRDANDRLKAKEAAKR